jgi:pimeloyl-ACP methyl ester carboxylesterase
MLRPVPVTERERSQVDAANASGKTPVVFVHGLWLLASSWDRWAERFHQEGFATLTPGWPGEPATVAEANANLDAQAGTSIAQIVDHLDEVIGGLERKPALVGHSFGGLMVEILAGRGRSAASVAISPAPFRGVLPVPPSALKAAWPVLRRPGNRKRAIPLSYEQFRYAFASAVTEDEAKELHETFAVPAPGKALFQAAFANVNPGTEAKVDSKSPGRGPLLIVGGELDRTVPWSIANASYKRERRNPEVTQVVKMPGRGHSLVIDSGWEEVADTALAFVQRFV